MPRKLFNFINENRLFVLIVFVAAGLRLFSLGQMPPSLNWDEISHGYNAYSILRTGKDEWGENFPLIFRAYGDYKLPVYIYLTALSEFFLGITAFAVRLPSALAGVGSVIFSYLLAKELFKKNEVAIITSLLVAIEPWSLFLSRGAFEANLALCLFVAGVYFFITSLEKPKNLVISAILLGLTVWTYNSYRIFTPLMLFSLLVIYSREVKNVYKKFSKIAGITVIILVVFLAPMFWQLLSKVGQARYGEVALIDDGAIAQIIEARQNSKYTPFVSRLIYNRPSYFFQRFVKNWGSHFTCSFLFFNGGSNYQFNIPQQGLLYLVNLPFFLLGIILLLKKIIKHDRKSMFLLSWILLAPIPSSLTREAPHVLRSITVLPVPMILSAFGLVWFVEWSVKFVGKMMRWPTWPSDIKITFSRDKALYLAYILILTILANNYLTKYFGEYKKDYSWSWQYGYKEVVQFSKKSYDRYDKIIVTKRYGEPHEFFLFYWPWDPKAYRNDINLVRYSQSNWFWVDAFDKFYFVNDWEIPKEEWQPFVLESGTQFHCADKCLLITSSGNVPKGWSKLETVNFLDGKPAFEMYEK